MKILQKAQCYSFVDGRMTFSHNNVLLTEHGDMFLAKFPQKTIPDGVSKASFDELTLIRKTSYCPIAPAGTTILSDPADFYVKRPDPISATNVNLAALVLQELEICEMIKKNPHPNLAVYHGCLVSDNPITGLCFTKYPQTVANKLSPGFLNQTEFLESEHLTAARKLAAETYLSQIEAGVRHLHTLGIVHNNLNPSNIAITEDDVPVIIDFDSSLALGVALGETKRTHGWFDKRDELSQSSNDIKALTELRIWLSGSSPEEFQFAEF